jgi:hypothetical protein
VQSSYKNLSLNDKDELLFLEIQIHLKKRFSPIFFHQLILIRFNRCRLEVQLRLGPVTHDRVLGRLATPDVTPGRGRDRPRQDRGRTVVAVIGIYNILVTS